MKRLAKISIKENENTFGQKIRFIRLACHLSQTEIAEATGYKGHISISKIENNSIRPDTDFLQKFIKLAESKRIFVNANILLDDTCSDYNKLLRPSTRYGYKALDKIDNEPDKSLIHLGVKEPAIGKDILDTLMREEFAMLIDMLKEYTNDLMYILYLEHKKNKEPLPAILERREKRIRLKMNSCWEQIMLFTRKMLIEVVREVACKNILDHKDPLVLLIKRLFTGNFAPAPMD